MLVAGTLFAHAPSAVAAPAIFSTTAASSPALMGQWVVYYPHYFSSVSKCSARGAWMKANEWWVADYQCFKASGDVKWSMRIYDINA